MTFDWKKLEDGYTLFDGDYHADVYRTFQGKYNWYAWDGHEVIGFGKGLDDSTVSRAAAENAFLEYFKSANCGK